MPAKSPSARLRRTRWKNRKRKARGAVDPAYRRKRSTRNNAYHKQRMATDTTYAAAFRFRQRQKAKAKTEARARYECASIPGLDWVLKARYRKVAPKGCEICTTPPTERRRLAIDHDHDYAHGTAFAGVRGFLCSPCNTGLGNLRHDPEFILAWGVRATSWIREVTTPERLDAIAPRFVMVEPHASFGYRPGVLVPQPATYPVDFLFFVKDGCPMCGVDDPQGYGVFCDPVTLRPAGMTCLRCTFAAVLLRRHAAAEALAVWAIDAAAYLRRTNNRLHQATLLHRLRPDRFCNPLLLVEFA